MKLEVPTPEDLSLQLLDMQLVPFEAGYVARRGSIRFFLEGEGLPTLFRILGDLARKPGGIRQSALMAAVPPDLQETARSLIEALKQRRFLVTAGADGRGADPTAHGNEVFFWSYGTTAAAVGDTLSAVSVAVVGFNHIALALVRSLREAGFGSVALIDHPMFRNVTLTDDFGRPLDAVAESVGEVTAFEAWAEAGALPDCLVVTADFGGLTLMREWNQFAVENGIHLFPIVLQDQIAFLGPLVVPSQGPCFECFWRRHNSNLEQAPLKRATERDSYVGQSTADFLPVMARMAAETAAMELIKHYSQALPGVTVGRVIEVDLVQPSLTARRLLKAPRCPVCSTVRSEPTLAAEFSTFMPVND